MIPRLDAETGKRHKSQRHEAGRDERDPRALQTIRHVTVFQLLPKPGEPDNGERPTNAATEPVDDAFAEAIAALRHEKRRAENGAIYGDQG